MTDETVVEETPEVTNGERVMTDETVVEETPEVTPKVMVRRGKPGRPFAKAPVVEAVAEPVVASVVKPVAEKKPELTAQTLLEMEAGRRRLQQVAEETAMAMTPKE